MLAPDRSRALSQIDHLTVANTEAVAWSKAITDAVLPPPPSNAPEWYEEAQTNLAAAAKDANTWVLEQGPRLFADCLQSSLTFANLFTVSAQRMKVLLDEARARGGTVSEAEREPLCILAQELLSEAKDQLNVVREHRDRLEVFRLTMAKHSATLRPITAQIKVSDEAEQRKLDELLGKMSALREDLAVLAAAEKSSTGSAATGTAKGIAGLTFGLWWAAGALSFSSVVGFAALGYEAYKVKQFMERYRKTFGAIKKLAGSLGDIGLQAMTLRQIDNILAQIEDKNGQASTGVESVDMVWSHLVDKLQTVCEILSQPIARVDAYSDLHSLEFAAKTWQALAQDVAQRQTLQMNIQNIELGH